MKFHKITAGFLGNNIYIIYDETKECCIVDPGAGHESVLSFIKQNQLKPKCILLTHGHYDHIGRISNILAQYDISVYIGKGDEIMLENPEKFNGRSIAKLSPDQYELIEDGKIILVGNMQIKTIATPGHTIGGVCFLVEDQMFSGDSIFLETIGRCDLYGGSLKTLMASVAKVSNLECDIHPGHGESTTMAHERKYNEYFPGNH